MTVQHSFTPPWYLRSGLLQSILASNRIRVRGKNPVQETARETIINTAEGVRLQGYLSTHGNSGGRGLVVMLHGWEGSVNSTYITCTSKALYQRGYDILRLNFRDHGDSHHLNQGIFYAILLDEVFQAVQQISANAATKAVCLAGFSLGGNFALRIARKLCDEPIGNLKRVVAISPVLDPRKATIRIDNHPLFRRYFLKKWFKSLQIKQGLFPEAWDFSEVFALDSVMAVTEKMIEKHSDFNSATEYFKGYTILNDALAELPVPTTILTAADDPIIPVDDFHQLKLNRHTRMIIHNHGGHNGFIENYLLKSWYEQKLADWFDEIT